MPVSGAADCQLKPGSRVRLGRNGQTAMARREAASRPVRPWPPLVLFSEPQVPTIKWAAAAAQLSGGPRGEAHCPCKPRVNSHREQGMRLGGPRARALSAGAPHQPANLGALGFHEPEQPFLPGPLCAACMGDRETPPGPAWPSPAHACHAQAHLARPCPDHGPLSSSLQPVAAPYTTMGGAH